MSTAESAPWLPDRVRSWSDEHQDVLEAVATAFVGACEWPQRADLQREMATELANPPALQPLLANMPKPLGFVAPPGDRVVLTVFGLQQTTVGRAIVEGFVRALRLSVDRYRNGDDMVS